MQWSQVELDQREITLYTGTTKSGRGRTLPIYDDMIPLFEELKRDHDQKYPNVTHVFHDAGEDHFRFDKSWASACNRAGLPNLLFHDLRRSAVRNLIRAGDPRSVAMQISGHKTESVFRRYDIVDSQEIRDAATKMTAFKKKGKVA